MHQNRTINNILYVAAAGAGKTTFLVRKALRSRKKLLITTYTDNGVFCIKEKIYEECGIIPSNLTVQTWYSFLLEHGILPYQSYITDKRIRGIYFHNGEAGNNASNYQRYTKAEINGIPNEDHYLTAQGYIYPDVMSKFICVVDTRSNGAITKRLSLIFDEIYIDEAQDMAGYDLDVIRILLGSDIRVYLACDPRQQTYKTNRSNKNGKYTGSAFLDFFKENCGELIKLDSCTLRDSHRNCQIICDFANHIFPNYPKVRSKALQQNTGHDGVFFVLKDDIDYYLNKYSPIQLRYNKEVQVNPEFQAVNFGSSKGRTYDRVLVYPTKDIINFFKTGDVSKLSKTTCSKLYVAVTRARYSVAFVVTDFLHHEQFAIQLYNGRQQLLF